MNRFFNRNSRGSKEVEIVKASDQPSIICPVCGKTSYHPEDIKQKYCGACHWWTSDPEQLANKLEVWIVTSEHGEVPEECPFHPAVLEALLIVLKRS